MTGARVSGDHRIGGVVRAESSEQELPAEHGQLLVHREHLRLSVQVVLGRHENGPRGHPQGRVLDGLKSADGGVAGVGVPNGGGIGEEWFDYGSVCYQEGLP